MTVFRVQSRDMSVISCGKIITYRRERTYPEYEVIVKATTCLSRYLKQGGPQYFED